jgi:hypothetical protein
LINQYIYATHPNQFNDIFDCNEELLDFDDYASIKAFLANSMAQEEIDNHINSNYAGIKTFVQRNFREKAYRLWGVFSMTANPNNVLMWSYYSNNSGFCIEFDITKFPFKYYGPFPINYQSEIKAISIKKIGVQIGVLVQSNIKDAIWQHEDEWRLLIPAPEKQEMVSPNFEILKALGGHNRKFYYPLDAIISISLGNKFFSPDEIHDIDEKSLEINLQQKFEQKSIVLDFLASNKILTHIGLRKGFTEIAFLKGNITRINCKKYQFNAH